MIGAALPLLGEESLTRWLRRKCLPRVIKAPHVNQAHFSTIQLAPDNSVVPAVKGELPRIGRTLRALRITRQNHIV